MDKKLEQIDLLLSIFDEREQTYEQITWLILETLEPTVLSVLYEMFCVTSEFIEWNQVDIIESMLQIVCTARYNSIESMPEFVKSLPASKELIDDKDYYECVVRIGFPLTVVCSSREKVRTFLQEALNQLVNSPTTISPSSLVSPSEQFDSSLLSKDQIIQMLTFQQYTKGVKH